MGKWVARTTYSQTATAATNPPTGFHEGRHGTVRSPGGLRKTLQVASEVTYMEHMCLSHLAVVAFTLAAEEGCEWVRRRWLTMTRLGLADRDRKKVAGSCFRVLSCGRLLE